MEFVVLVFALFLSQVNAVSVPKHCHILCPGPHHQICGNDGVTYLGECEMRIEGCLQKKAINAVREGRCPEKERCKLGCSTAEKTECGSDGKLYINECKRREASCKTGKAINFVRPAFAKNDNCNSCDLACSNDERHVCGSDGNTYKNDCQLRLRSCQIKSSIIRIFKGKCKM